MDTKIELCINGYNFNNQRKDMYTIYSKLINLNKIQKCASMWTVFYLVVVV